MNVELESDGTTNAPREMDWNLLFSAAGLDRRAFQQAPPSWTPPVASDDRAAWTGVFPEQRDMPLRLEAAAYRGRLVAFRSFGPWPSQPRRSSVNAIPNALANSILFVSALLAWFNARTDRVDRRGAIRLVVPLFSLALGTWIVGAHHVVALETLQQFRHAISQALVGAGFTGLAYLAVEPHVRRRWPAVLVAWSRVFAGRWRDPRCVRS